MAPLPFPLPPMEILEPPLIPVLDNNVSLFSYTDYRNFYLD